MKRTEIGKHYLEVTELYSNCTKPIIIENFERIFGDSGMLRNRKDMTRSRIIINITERSLETVQAWFNRGRPKLNIPPDCICEIAEFLRLDVKCFLTDRGDWRKGLTSRQVCMFEDIRKKQYFGENWWRFFDFAEDLARIELFDNTNLTDKHEQLYKDVMDYFTIVVGYDEDDISEEVRKATNAVSL